MKKSLLLLISLFSLSLGACGVTSVSQPSQEPQPASQSTSEQSSSVDEEIYQVYQLYLSNGGTQTYDEWLASIKGEKGADGTSVLTGNGIPENITGKNGDSFINIDNWDYYYKTNDTWIKLGNIQGGQGEAGPQGEQGPQGDPGEDGISIISIEKTNTEGLVDTYTITYSDETTSTFNVTNGEQGIQGIQGVKGDDGHTPVVIIGENGNWFIDGIDSEVRAQGPQGIQGVPGKDGSSVLTGSGVPENTTGKNGDSFINIENWDYYFKANDTWIKLGNIKGDKGDKGETGDTGPQGEQGDKGEDGVSIASIEKTGTDGNIDTYTITLSNGNTSTFTVVNGVTPSINEQGLDFFLRDDGTYYVGVGTAYYLSDIYIPETFNGHTVTGILGGSGFSFDHSLLKTLHIPSSIDCIEQYALDGCSNFTDVYFDGTQELWFEKVNSGNWNYTFSRQTIHCVDGDIGLDKTIFIWCNQLTIDTTRHILNAYKETHPNFDYKFVIEPRAEIGVATSLITHPNAGADVYVFTQDDLPRLVAANVISALPETVETTVKEDNDLISVTAATFNDTLYAYPIASDNTFFLYYDKRVLNEDDVKDIDTILAKCNEAGKYFYMDLAEPWFSASFFYAVGAKSEWTANIEGNFIAYDDTFKDNGLEAMKEMNKLASSSAFKNGSTSNAFEGGAAALISGKWSFTEVKSSLGDNMGVAVLPSWIGEDSVKYTLKPFATCKLIGTKPQDNAERTQIVSEIALALSNKDMQLARFEEFGWVPSNKEAQNDTVVKNDSVASIAIAQVNQGVAQGPYPDGWWSIAASLTSNLGSKTDEQLLQMLQSYNNELENLLVSTNSSINE